MSININNYPYIYTSVQDNIGYVNKYEKSLKLPFLNVMNNHLLSSKPSFIDEPELDESDIAVSDNIELSSAVTGASQVSESGDGSPDTESAT